MRVSQSAILIQYMVKLVKPISPGSDTSLFHRAGVAGSSHHKDHLQPHLWALQLICTWAVNAALAEISALGQTLPCSSLDKAVHHHHHSLHAQSPPAAFASHTLTAAGWHVSPAGAAGRRRQSKRFPHYHGSPWMTSKGYIDPIFRRLAGRALPVQTSLFQSFIQ